MRRILLGAVTSLAVICAAPLDAYADSSRVVVCGQTLTHDIRLANDLVNCPADGLIIGADHITVDLAGHSVDGVNAAGSEGVSNADFRVANRLLPASGHVTPDSLSGKGIRPTPVTSGQ